MTNLRPNQQSFKCSPPKYKYSHKLEHFKYLSTPYKLKLATKKAFVTKSLKRGFRFCHYNWYVNNMEGPFFPTKIEARRELARIGLISEQHYHPQIIQFDVLDDPRWQANVEAKQGRFELDRYRSFAFQHGNMVYNPRGP